MIGGNFVIGLVACQSPVSVGTVSAIAKQNDVNYVSFSVVGCPLHYLYTCFFYCLSTCFTWLGKHLLPVLVESEDFDPVCAC